MPSYTVELDVTEKCERCDAKEKVAAEWRIFGDDGYQDPIISEPPGWKWTGSNFSRELLCAICAPEAERHEAAYRAREAGRQKEFKATEVERLRARLKELEGAK